MSRFATLVSRSPSSSVWERKHPGWRGRQRIGHRRHTVNIIGVIPAVPRDLARVEPTSAPIIGFNLVALAEAAAAARRTRPGPRSIILADQALRDARLSLAVVVGDVVRIVAAVSGGLPGVELAPAAVIGFDLIALAESITTSAVGVAAPAVERRDEAGLDARFGFAIVLCERPS